MKNGSGPTALLTGGNHGDEYEGPVALFNFAGRTRIADIQGRVIVVPAMNYPAFEVATRVSPIDGLNLNRIFPGRPDGTVTEIIADYFSRILLPLADYVLDIHSGGKTLDFVPFAACHRLEDEDYQARCESAMKAANRSSVGIRPSPTALRMALKVRPSRFLASLKSFCQFSTAARAASS